MRPSNTNTQAVERDIAANGEAPASDEQAADLAALEAAAGQGGAPGQALATQEQEPKGPTLQEEIAGLMGMVVAVLSPALPSLKTIYTPEAIGAASGAIGALCEKHGWLGDGLMGQYGAEIACVAVVGPLAWATYNGVSADLAEWKKRRPIEATAKEQGIDIAAPVPAPPPAPERTGPAVTFGSGPVQ
ncbi:hypothetical protein [Hydrogenophaga intermedia]|uniref:Uncharacterized protein n=1 Tax=Hydrogenophaga intermedia TaxID=65786 RepID=A0A1L1PN81_HYDIT|nr:hypothetical protein [Hydrogenophaga intermedia]TMU72429.1 hypothetical protein FGJ01_18820 [Hydrogenophaga intermedia]CDN87496.1 hypothetical protein BN948_01918 [Hydrogenophaga intermedia]